MKRGAVMTNLAERLPQRTKWQRFVLRLRAWSLPQCRAKHPERRLDLQGRPEPSRKTLCCTRWRFHFGRHIDMNGDRWSVKERSG